MEAVFEGGVFKPVRRLEIPEGEHVRLIVETSTRREHEDPLELAKRVYQGLRPEEINEIERIALDRSQLGGIGRHGRKDFYPSPDGQEDLRKRENTRT